MKAITYLLAGFFSLQLSIGTANTGNWVLKREANNIKVYQKPSGSGYAFTRGTMSISSTAEDLITFMKDRTNCQKWVYACLTGNLVTEYDANNRLDYTVIDSPLWFSDRDFYIHSTTHYNPQSKLTTIKLLGKENYKESHKGKVRIRDLYGLWRLQAMDDNTLSVLYQLHGNPQLLPSVLLDAYMVESIHQTLNNLQKAALKHYQ